MTGIGSFERLAARLADPAPAFECEGFGAPGRTLVAVEHRAGAPATAAEIAWLQRQLDGVAGGLVTIWARWNGIMLGVEPGTTEPSFLVALHPIGEAMLAATAGVHSWVEELGALELEDPDGLASAVAIGGPAASANALVVLTRGSRAGAICVFDHETLVAEPFAANVDELLERLADDPVALVEPLGGTTRYRWDEGQLFPVAYLADGRGR